MQDWIKPVQDFVTSEEGRWACIGVVAVLVFLLVLKSVLRRSGKRELPNLELLEELATYPPAPPLEPRSKQLILHGLPVRIRLIVIGPLGMDAGGIDQHDVEPVLNRMVPGLSDRLHADLPRVRLWPTQLSYAGFIAAFRRNTTLPEGEERVRPWVLIMGKVLRDGSPIAVGMALQSSEENTLGPVILQHAHQWMEVLRFARGE